MSTFDRQSYYYSGQGVVMLAERGADGNPKGFTPVGNVSAAEITIETTTQEHKESQSGQRATDLRLVTDTLARLSLTVENFESDVLALALRGGFSEAIAGSVSGEALKLYNGKIVGLAKIDIASLALERGAQALTAYVDDATAYDYKVNEDAGSVEFNDGSVVAVDKLTTGGTAPSGITAGATTTVTVANTAAPGEYVVFTGFGGADAAIINGKAFKILTASPTDITIDLNSTGKTLAVGTPLSAFDGIALTADYNYGAQNRVEALSEGVQERWLRFEGLNTADGNAPVVVDVFKFTVDPAQAFPMIGEAGQAQFVLQGSILSDALRPSGSKFFRQTLLR